MFKLNKFFYLIAFLILAVAVSVYAQTSTLNPDHVWEVTPGSDQNWRVTDPPHIINWQHCCSGNFWVGNPPGINYSLSLVPANELTLNTYLGSVVTDTSGTITLPPNVMVGQYKVKVRISGISSGVDSYNLSGGVITILPFCGNGIKE